MAWLNIAAKTASTVLVLPLMVRNLDAASVAVYYLLTTGASFILLTCSGFAPTISRFVGFGLASQKDNTGAGSLPNIDIGDLLATMRRVYATLSVVALHSMVVVGSFCFSKPISVLQNPNEGWHAWFVICAATPFTLFGSLYSAVIQGSDNVALEQKWAAVFSILAAFSTAGVLIAGGGLLALITATQIWQVIGCFRLRFILERIKLPSSRYHSRPLTDVFQEVLKPSWRALVGIVAYNGTSVGISIVLGQIMPPPALASFMLMQRVMSIGTEISKAPFYGTLPRLVILLRESKEKEFVALARRGMRNSYLSFSLFLAPLVVLGKDALALLGSQVEFQEPFVLSLYAFALLLERHGAMHLQLFTASGKVIWHWVNGALGLVWGLLLAVKYPHIDVTYYAISLTTALALTYVPVSVYFSLKTLNQSYFNFEKVLFLPFLGIFLLGLLMLHNL